MNSSHTDVQVLAARLETLEASNRRRKLANTLPLLSGVSLVLVGPKAADRIDPGVVHALSFEATHYECASCNWPAVHVPR